MTTYYANSGAVGSHPVKAEEYFKALTSQAGPAPKILIACFAVPREDWETKFVTKYTPTITRALGPERRPVYQLALPKTFADQVDQADAVYLPGGDFHLVQYWLNELDAVNVWSGQQVGVNSASTQALASVSWVCDWREIIEGAGVLPMKFIAHYQSHYAKDDPRGPIDWDAAYAELAAYGDPSLPLHALPEGEFIKFAV